MGEVLLESVVESPVTSTDLTPLLNQLSDFQEMVFQFTQVNTVLLIVLLGVLFFGLLFVLLK